MLLGGSSQANFKANWGILNEHLTSGLTKKHEISPEEKHADIIRPDKRDQTN